MPKLNLSIDDRELFYHPVNPLHNSVLLLIPQLLYETSQLAKLTQVNSITFPFIILAACRS